MPMPKVDLARRLEIEERQAKVLALRLDNVSLEEIAALFGVSTMTISRDYYAALARHRDNTLAIAGQVKAQNQARLERIIHDLSKTADKDPKAYDRMMRAMDMQNKMYGVYGADVQQGSTQQGNSLTIRYEQTHITVNRDSTPQPQQDTQYIIGSAAPTLTAGSVHDSDADVPTAYDADADHGSDSGNANDNEDG